MSSEKITLNGNDYDPEVVSQGLQLISANARGLTPSTGSGLGGADISSTGSITRWQGQQYGGNRDIYDVLGYDDLDDNTALEKYRAKYNRQDIAKRVIDVFPEETWKNTPKVIDEGESETEFERLANNLIRSELTNYWRRLDRAQRLGEYGVMVIGFGDGQDLSEPVNPGGVSSPDDLDYYDIFPQEQVENWRLGKDTEGEASNPSHARYNKPVYYTLDFGDIDGDSTDDEFGEVHWSRVIHVAEDALETDLKGQPALKPIYNRLDDRMKVIGASAEMFYTGADRKIIANVRDDFALEQYSDTGQREDFKSQLNNLINDFQQAMVGTGMDFEVLGGQETNPEGVVKQIDSSIAAATGIPMNKLRGNETGQRSTTMDRENWFDTIRSRQTNFATPQFIRATLNRLLEYGILPNPVNADYGVEWPDLQQPDQATIADTQSSRAAAMQGSGLAMTLTREQKLQYLEGGPSAVDTSSSGPVEMPVNETDGVNDAFHASFESESDVGSDVENANRYKAGDTVKTPKGVGVVMDVLTKPVDNQGRTIEASDSSPTYVVIVEDGRTGMATYKASELSATEITTDVSNPTKDLAKNVEGTNNTAWDMLADLLSRNAAGDGHFEWPKSWRESKQPARVIALHAFASMGGSFDGCVRHMRGDIVSPERFCADFIDRLVGNPYWRGQTPFPGS